MGRAGEGCRRGLCFSNPRPCTSHLCSILLGCPVVRGCRHGRRRRRHPRRLAAGHARLAGQAVRLQCRGPHGTQQAGGLVRGEGGQGQHHGPGKRGGRDSIMGPARGGQGQHHGHGKRGGGRGGGGIFNAHRCQVHPAVVGGLGFAPGQLLGLALEAVALTGAQPCVMRRRDGCPRVGVRRPPHLHRHPPQAPPDTHRHHRLQSRGAAGPSACTAAQLPAPTRPPALKRYPPPPSRDSAPPRGACVVKADSSST